MVSSEPEISMGKLPHGEITLDKKDIEIIRLLEKTVYPTAIIEQVNFSKSTIYRHLNKLLSYNIVIANKDTLPAQYFLNPNFIGVSKSRVAIFDLPSKTASFSKQTLLFENSNATETMSYSQSLEKKSSKKNSEILASSTDSKIPSENSSIDEPKHSEAKRVIGPIPNDENNRENSETSNISPRNFPEEQPHYNKKHGIIIRSHNFLYKIPIQRKPLNLEKRLEKTTWLEVKRMKNWSYYCGQPKAKGKIDLAGIECHIQFNPNVILVWLNEIFGRDPEENLIFANQKILEIRAFIEDSYSGLYLGPHFLKRMIENAGVHQAWTHQQLALECKKKNVKLKGKNWEIDSSKGIPELEAVHKTKSTEHCVKELEDFDFRADNDFYFKDAALNQKQISENIAQSSEVLNSLTQQHVHLTTGTMTLFDITAKATAERIEVLEENHKLKQELSSMKELFESEITELRNQFIELKDDFVEATDNATFYYQENQRLQQQNQGDLTTLQRDILEVIRSHPGLTRKQLAEVSGIKLGSINGHIRRLIRKRILIERQEEGETSKRIYLRN
jgi:DNA-binding MarR family transcriptional regulator/DNA-binding transcriptional ArsR family regulator